MLMAPIERIPRYLLALRSLEKWTVDEETRRALTDAITAVTNLAREVNFSLQLKDAMDKVAAVQRKIEGGDQIMSPTRYHVRNSVLLKKSSKPEKKDEPGKQYWFYLFNDLLIYTSLPNAKGRIRVKYKAPLNKMTIIDWPTDSNEEHMLELTTKGKEAKTIFVQFRSLGEKQSWHNSLKKCVFNVKRVTSALQERRAKANRAEETPSPPSLSPRDHSPNVDGDRLENDVLLANGSYEQDDDELKETGDWI